MQVSVTGWKCVNLRGGLRDVEIDLGSPPRRWNLVQMPNGTGKTTTMTLLRYAFTGDPFPPDVVYGLRVDDNVESGQFELRLNVDDKPYRIVIDLDFKSGRGKYSTARSAAKKGGLDPGWLLPESLKDLLTRSLVELFVFDGELANDIRAVGKDRATAAIEALYRLDPLQTLQKQISRLVEEKFAAIASISTAREESALRRLKTSYEKSTVNLARLRAENQRHAERRSKLTKRCEIVAAEIEAILASDAGLQGRLQKLAEDTSKNSAAINDAVGEAVAALRTPACFHPRLRERLQHLGDRLYTLKLPESISREFFIDLSKQQRCVCGRLIEEHDKEAILARADSYLAQDQISVINQMKLALRENTSDPAQFQNASAKLSLALRAKQELAHDRDKMEREKVASGDGQLAELKQELIDGNAELLGIEDFIERLTTKDLDRQDALDLSWEDNIPLCSKEVEDRKRRYDTATNMREYTLQATFVNGLIESARSKALDLLRERVRQATNAKLREIVKTETLEVARITGRLEISSDQLASKGDLSEGQKLAVAYAFLTSLLQDAPYKLPFIVDSPAVSLDVKMRQEVGELIPDFFDQMIMFVISSERQGFADAFYTRNQSDVRYLTLVPLGGGRVDLQEGQVAFDKFHGRDIA